MNLETSVRKAINDALPYLSALNGTVPLKVLTGAQAPFSEQASYNDGFYFQQITDISTGIDYYKLVVFDMDGSRATTLKSATVFARDGHIFKKSAPDPPIYVAPVWEFRVKATGQRM